DGGRSRLPTLRPEIANFWGRHCQNRGSRLPKMGVDIAKMVCGNVAILAMSGRLALLSNANAPGIYPLGRFHTKTSRSARQHRGILTMSTTPLVKNRQLYINGEWCDSSTGKKLGVVNPATEETIAEVSFGNRADAAKAVAAASAALPAWMKLTA